VERLNNVPFHYLPLMCGVVGIMRPSRYARESLLLAESLGLDALLVPMIEVREYKDDGFEGFVGRVLGGDSDYVTFTSVNGVEFTMKRIDDAKGFVRALNDCCKVAAIGPRTARALEEAGIRVTLIPKTYSSSGLLDLFQSGVSERVVEVVRSTHGAPLLVDELVGRGAEVHETCVYTLARPRGEEQYSFVRRVLDSGVDGLAFTSTMMVHNFMKTAQDLGVLEGVVNRLGEIAVGAIGLPTGKTLKSYGVNGIIVPEKFLFKDLLLALKEAICRS